MITSTQTITVDGIGVFTLRRRTLRVEIQISAEFNRLAEGQDTLAGWFRDLCEMVAYLKGVVVEAPPGWDLDAMDPEPETYQRIVQVFTAAREKEATFRPKPPAQP